MYGIDVDGLNLDEVFTDSRLIDEDRLRNTCEIGTKKACKYISKLDNKAYCMKHTPIAITINKMVVENKQLTHNDNCRGLK